MNAQRNFTVEIVILATFLLSVGCGGQRERSSQDRKADPAATETARLRIEQTTTRLEPSRVETSAVEETSQTGGSDPSSQIAVQQVESSEVQRVEQLMTDLNAQRTSQGIIINLPENILFDFDKYDIRADARPTLQKLYELISYYKEAPVEINGHTDSKGSDQYNQTLSERRAASVKKYLVDNFGLSPDRLQTRGFGETKPIAPNTNPDGSDNPEGRQKNRRVEVIIKPTGAEATK